MLECTKVNRIEVKRCFVASEKVKKLLNENDIDLQTILNDVKNGVQKMSESELEHEITWPPRLETYNSLSWYFQKCSIDDLVFGMELQDSQRLGVLGHCERQFVVFMMERKK